MNHAGAAILELVTAVCAGRAGLTPRVAGEVEIPAIEWAERGACRLTTIIPRLAPRAESVKLGIGTATIDGPPMPGDCAGLRANSQVQVLPVPFRSRRAGRAQQRAADGSGHGSLL